MVISTMQVFPLLWGVHTVDAHGVMATNNNPMILLHGTPQPSPKEGTFPRDVDGVDTH